MPSPIYVWNSGPELGPARVFELNLTAGGKAGDVARQAERTLRFSWVAYIKDFSCSSGRAKNSFDAVDQIGYIAPATDRRAIAIYGQRSAPGSSSTEVADC